LNIEKTPDRIVMERRIVELRILLVHSISDRESLELAAKLEETGALKTLHADSQTCTRLKRLLNNPQWPNELV
jgi:Tfp pilus assembly ATPase PilU